MVMRPDLPFSKNLPDFQRLFPNDAACGAYLERLRWPAGFACPKCGVAGEPYRFEAMPGKLRCRASRTVEDVITRTMRNAWLTQCIPSIGHPCCDECGA